MFVWLDDTAIGQLITFFLIVILPGIISAARYQWRKVRYGSNIYKGFCLSKEPEFSKLSVKEMNNRRREFNRRNHGS